ncbi:dihydrouridine synthase [Podospora conica]|nr:dihydrouridine synthase [Schizothecium conicum]
MASTAASPTPATATPPTAKPKKLHGRAFYESIGSPKFIVAPMVDQSEYAWRMLSRSFLPESQRRTILAYTPMFHARLFSDSEKYRDSHFQPLTTPSDPAETPQPWLDGNPATDRPLFVQFCANDPDALLAAARHVAPHCDAVDLNLGCPQGIARKGHYGAFLQEDQDLIFRLINILHVHLDIPVTAKIRILDTREATLAYAQNVLRAGASILAVHGRRREQKGHLTGLADWDTLRWLRAQLPPDTVMFANGNILEHADVARCLAATGVDGIMSAEGNLSNPGIFAAPPPLDAADPSYWRSPSDPALGGWRLDEAYRRYLDIIYSALNQPPPTRRKLFVPGDDESFLAVDAPLPGRPSGLEPPRKKRREAPSSTGGPAVPDSAKRNPNVVGMQGHLFHLLRHLVALHTDVRDALGRQRLGDLAAHEALLAVVEQRVARGILEYEATGGASLEAYLRVEGPEGEEAMDDTETSARTARRVRRPWWVAQPIVRPLPREAMLKGAIREKKKGGAAVAEGKDGVAGAVEEEKKEGVAAQGGQEEEDPVTVAARVRELKRKTSFHESELVSG